MNAALALAISIFVGVGGQLSLKAGALNSTDGKSFIFQPYVLLGLCLYFGASFFYIYALRFIPVSVAFPCVSISYVAVAFLAHLIWREPFGARQLASLFLIGLGIFTLSRP